MGKTEEQIYNELMQSSPGNAVSAQTKASAAALANAEAAAANTEYVPGGADRELDKAINEYLSGRGFEYSTENDKDYQAFRQQYRKFADEGRKQGVENTNTLANGYTPTYLRRTARLRAAAWISCRYRGRSDIFRSDERCEIL